jgi:dienelactone hydrolase
MFKQMGLLFLISVCSAAYAQPPQAVLDLISRTYNPAIKAQQKDITKWSDFCRQVEVDLIAQDPVTLKPGHVKFTTFVLRGSESVQQNLKTVIVMPPTGGVNALDWAYASRLCLAGMRAAVVTKWDHDTFNELDMGMHDRGALRALAAVRHTIEFLKPTRPKQLGILGTSVGAITSSLATGYDARISAAALIVGGGGLREIIARSTEQHLSDLRKKRMAAYKLTSIDAYQQMLSPHINIDPIDFINFSGPKNIWMMIATDDLIVPTANQFQMYNAYGRPAGSLTYPSDHFKTILYTSLAQGGKIVEFFERVLE